MKTLLLYNDGENVEPKFLELEGDYRHLNGVYIGEYVEDEEEAEKHEALEQELMKILQKRTKFLSEPTKDWDFFIHCGVLP